MRVQVAGRHVNVGETLRSRIITELDEKISGVFDRVTDATVTVARANVGYVVDCVVKLPSGVSLQAEGSGADAHKAFDTALQKIRNRTRRYKQRLRRRHNASQSSMVEPLPALLLPEADSAEAESDVGTGSAPLVIAETKAAPQTLSVSQAVAELDRTHGAALLFRSASNGRLNMVYRRGDGNVGWVDPACDDVLNGHEKSA